MSIRRLHVVALLLALILPILVACGGGDAGGAVASAPGVGASTEAEASLAASPEAEASEEAASPEAEASEEAASPEASEEAEASAEASEEAGASAEATSEAGTGSTATAGGTELDFSAIEVEEGATLRFAAAGNTTEQQLYQAGAERFNELFADRNVTMTFEPVPAEYETTITAGFSGGNAPDVFLLNGQLMGQLGPQNLLLPLNDAMEQVGRSADDFYPQLTELYQLEDQTYGLPKDFNPLVLFINNSLAEQAGVDPASLQTWDDLRSAAQAISESGVGGLCYAPDIERFGAFMFQNGNPIIENNEAVFNNESGVEAIQFFRDLQNEGFASTFQDLGASWCGEAFASQQAGMTIEGGWLVPFMADPANAAQDVEYTAVLLPIPEGGEQSSLLFTNAFAANANTPYPNAAAAAVLFLTSEQNQQALIESGLAQPSLQSLANDPYYTENEVAGVLVQAAQNGRVSETTFGGVQKKADVVRSINQTGIEPIFVGGADVQQSLDAAAQEVNGVLQQ